MKISKLYIDQFRHLENLTFDFTYPDDFHIKEKRGKPLDKICFIGQSATGKTNLLELIYNDIQSIKSIEIDEDGNLWGHQGKINSNLKIEIDNKLIETKIDFKKDGFENGYIEIFVDDNKLLPTKRSSSFISNLLKNLTIGEKLLFLKAELLTKKSVKIFEEKPALLIEKYKLNTPENSTINDDFIFNEETDEFTWAFLLNKNINHNQKFIQFASELINSGNILDNSNSQKKIDEWKKINPDPLIDFSEKFDLLLEKINLEVDLISKSNIIPLKNKITNTSIPIEQASTGTKQLLLTSIALDKIYSQESIILIDEPERSLYPDIQMELMEHYQKLAKDAQFIVATHSPFIAASFEPEERFILYFDEVGKVAVRRGSSPIGDDPNDMLKNDFGVNYYNKFGEEAYKRYLNLKEDLAKEKDPIKKKELLLETVKLGDTYNF